VRLRLFTLSANGISGAAIGRLALVVALGLACDAHRSGGRENPKTGGPASTRAADPKARATSALKLAPVRPRLVAYVNCLCGFGVGTSKGACLAEPDPHVNHVKLWEERGVSPITHYVIAFLSFKGSSIATDSASVWASGGGSTTDFELDDRLRDALEVAQAKGKKVLLSLGGEGGSNGFLAWAQTLSQSNVDRVLAMRSELERVARRFTQQNGLSADGFDFDIELGGLYSRSSQKYIAIRDLIDAVRDDRLVAFAPQVANGLCAAPAPGDVVPASVVLGGQCASPTHDDSPWVLAQLDQDCKRADGRPKLDYFGIQYYNVGEDECCGGGSDAATTIRSTVQNYVNLANGWPASKGTSDPTLSGQASSQSPGSWPAFVGLGADRLVIGKPGCRGCAFSNYLDPASMKQLIAQLDRRLRKPVGGIMFWDLCRIFGYAGGLCLGQQCQPSWGGQYELRILGELQNQMALLRPL
jgi:chitinase